MQKAPSRMVKDLEKLVKPHGWTWHLGKSHVHFKGPNGKGMVVVSSSRASDHRAFKNAVSTFRQQGCPL